MSIDRRRCQTVACSGAQNGCAHSRPRARPARGWVPGKGLLFGLYGASSEVTCAKREGNLFHEVLDAQAWDSSNRGDS